MSTHFKLAIGAALAALALAPVAAQKPLPEGKQKNPVERTKVENGWIQLFNGKDLTGWRGYKMPDATQTSWRVEDGLLTVPATGQGDTHGRRDLRAVPDRRV